MTRKELIDLYATVTSEIAKLPANRGAARTRLQKARGMIDATIHATPRDGEPDATNCEQIQAQLKTAREFAKNPPAAPKKSGGKSEKKSGKKSAGKKSGKKKSGKK